MGEVLELPFMTVPLTDVVIMAFGVPQPAGSKTPFAAMAGPRGTQHYTGKVGMRDGRTKASAERHKSWRSVVTEAAISVMDGRERLTGGLMLMVTFTLDRPASHWLKSGKLSAAGRAMPVPSMRPDGTKLLRSVEDSLQDAGVYKDDAQIVRWFGAKEWTRPMSEPGRDVLNRPGVVIRVRPLS